MANRLPTQQQYERLRILNIGKWIVAGRRRDWGPLIRRGWAKCDVPDEGKSTLPFVHITPAGLRAVADAAEKYGMPDLSEVKPRREAL